MYTVESAKREIEASIRGYFEKTEDGKYYMPESAWLPMYLIGPPGVGKTALVSQAAEEMGIGFVSCSITHFTRNSLLGLPVIKDLENGEKYTAYTMSEIIAKVIEAKNDGHEHGILLIDEFASMAESLIAPMLAFLQTKNIGTHRLPEGWIMVLCSNPPEYNSTARKFDMAIMDRVRVMEIAYDKKEYLSYALRQGMNRTIIEYLKNNPESIYSCEENADGTDTIVTTRGWENLSYVIDSYSRQGMDVSQDTIRQIIKSEKIANKFFKYYCMACSTMNDGDLSNIMEGREIEAIAAAHKENDFSQKWNIMQMIEDALFAGSREYTHELGLYDLMNGVFKKFNKTTNDLNSPLLILSMAESLKSRLDGNGFCNFEEWKSKLDPREAEAITTILKDAGGSSNEEVAASYKSWLEGEKFRHKKKAAHENVRIANAITFMELITGDEGLIDSLIGALNSNTDVLRVLSAGNNKVYAKAAAKYFDEDFSANE